MHVDAFLDLTKSLANDLSVSNKHCQPFQGADWWGSASHPAGADGGRGVPWIFSGGGRNP